MTGTLTCTTTAVGREPGRRRTRSRAAPASPTTASTSSTTTPTRNYTVTKAPLTVTADSKSRLFGQANPPLTATLSGFVLGQSLAHLGRHRRGVVHDDGDAVQPGRRLPDHLHAGDADRGELQLRPVRRPARSRSRTRSRASPAPHRPAHGARGPGDLHRAGRASTGPITVNPGGALDIEGGDDRRPDPLDRRGRRPHLRRDVDRPAHGHRHTGLVLIGGDAATGPCAGNTLTGPVVDHRQHRRRRVQRRTASPARSRSPATRAASRRRTPARCTPTATRSSARSTIQ